MRHVVVVFEHDGIAGFDRELSGRKCLVLLGNAVVLASRPGHECAPAEPK